LNNTIMRLTAATILAFIGSVVPSTAQILVGPLGGGPSDMLQVSFKINEGYKNVDNAIDNFMTGKEQPPCMDSTQNYIFCGKLGETVDDFELVIHPVAPSGTKIGDLAGTSDYNMASDMVQGIIDSISYSVCQDPGQYGLATYQWLSALDGKSAVTATSVVKSFSSNDDLYVCGTGPLIEIPL